MSILIRPAEPSDALAVARIHVRAWQSGYRGLLAQEYLDQLKPEDRAPRYDFANSDLAKPKTFVAIDGNVVVGFATVAPAKEADLVDHGELNALHVDPDRWQSGIGTTLILEAQQILFARGFRRAILWVLAGNERAERFYRRHGWSADGQRRSDIVWGIAADEIRYSRALNQR
jgi:ribosomal protein S18 acetylase RimI-like enzyme